MFEWIGENMGTIVVSLALVGAVAWIVVKMRRDRRQGKGTCGCGCESCPMSGACHRGK